MNLQIRSKKPPSDRLQIRSAPVPDLSCCVALYTSIATKIESLDQLGGADLGTRDVQASAGAGKLQGPRRQKVAVCAEAEAPLSGAR